MRKEQLFDLIAFFGVSLPVLALLFELESKSMLVASPLFIIGFAMAASSGIWLTSRIAWMHKHEEELAGRA